jgi:hypothetical protein
MVGAFGDAGRKSSATQRMERRMRESANEHRIAVLCMTFPVKAVNQEETHHDGRARRKYADRP